MPAALSTEEMTGLVEDYGDEMLRLASIYLGSREMAEDAVQDSFLKIFRHYQPGPNPRAFVMKVLVNTCKDLLKNSWRRRVDLVANYPDLWDGREEPGPPGLLLQQVMGLKPVYRQVILLHYYEGFSVGQIAQLLKCPQPTVSIRLRRARQKLEEGLEGAPYEDL